MKSFKRKISENSRETKSSIDHEKAWGFYNKDYQGNPGKCVAGSIQRINSSHYFLLKYVVEQGTNNIAGIYGPLIMMKVEKEKEPKHL